MIYMMFAGQFLWCLRKHLPRTTTLTSVIFSIAENFSMWTQKARCPWELGHIYSNLSHFIREMHASAAAYGECIIK